jgi:sterol carrier protein 2
MSNRVIVAGVGVIPFRKPGADDGYVQMGADAMALCLQDAGVSYDDVQQAYAGYVYGDSCAGQRVIYQAGMTGIPIINVNNNCATGSSALFLARQAVASGDADCALAIGFEQMRPGALGNVFTDRKSPFDLFDAEADRLVGHGELPIAIRYFGGAGLAHMRQYGTRLETFARIRAKASRHAEHNPIAIFRKPMTVEDVMASPMLWDGVMTRLMACPPTCGAAAALLCSPELARRQGLDTRVMISAQAMTTDLAIELEARDMRDVVGASMAKAAADLVYQQAGVGPEAIDVVELHDCFAQNELISYEALGLCAPGEAEKFVNDNDNTYGGAVVVNPSGGLLSKGHPLGATGIAQCAELTSQLRGIAGVRQVERARLALQHNLGLGGACVVTLYEKAS